jgi:hypothetical protein
VIQTSSQARLHKDPAVFLFPFLQFVRLWAFAVQSAHSTSNSQAGSIEPFAETAATQPNGDLIQHSRTEVNLNPSHVNLCINLRAMVSCVGDNVLRRERNPNPANPNFGNAAIPAAYNDFDISIAVFSDGQSSSDCMMTLIANNRK